MTIVRVNGLTAAADAALETQKDRLFANRRSRLMVVAELKHHGRNQPGADEDREDIVTMRVALLEAAQTPKQDELLRKAMEALKLQRTAHGTLDEQLKRVKLSKSTVEDCAGDLAITEMARQRAALLYICERLDRLGFNGGWTETQLRNQIRDLHRTTRRVLDFDPTVKLDETPSTGESGAQAPAQPDAEASPEPSKAKRTRPKPETTAAQAPAEAKPAPDAGGRLVELTPKPNAKPKVKAVPEATFTPAADLSPAEPEKPTEPAAEAKPRKRAVKTTPAKVTAAAT